jgi:hypothetical protein
MRTKPHCKGQHKSHGHETTSSSPEDSSATLATSTESSDYDGDAELSPGGSKWFLHCDVKHLY